MPEHEAVVPLGRPAVLAAGDLLVGAAHAQGDAVDLEVAGVGSGLGDVGDVERAALERDDGERAHGPS